MNETKTPMQQNDTGKTSYLLMGCGGFLCVACAFIVFLIWSVLTMGPHP